MVGRRVKKKDTEKLTESNIAHVISLLEADTPITKKEACAILHISYNTTRLKKIIEEYKSDKEYRTKRKAEKRGKPANDKEKAAIAEAYLEGDSISDIAKRVFRSSAFVKNIIENLGVPLRTTGEEKAHTEFLPEACVADEFEPGEIAWSAFYHAPCEIKEELADSYRDKYTVPCYKVWVREKIDTDSKFFGYIENGGFNAFIPAYDLGKLSHLKTLGVNVDRI